MTADYAMQNVASQMGMKLLSLDGRKIKEIRRFIWECYLCWKQYNITDNKVHLCKDCGYNSLSKIAYTINEKGQMILHRKKNWQPNKNVLEWKEKKYEQQQKRKKNQYPRRKKCTFYFYE
jgi:RNA-binding protein NOB1